MVKEVLSGLGLLVDETGNIIREHSQEELDMTAAKSSILEMFKNNHDSKKSSALEELNYDQLVKEQSKQAAIPSNPMVDYVQIGESTPINVALHRTVNDLYSHSGMVMRHDAAHLSVNIQRSSDSGEFSIHDKEVVRKEPNLFNHRSSKVDGKSIIQCRPEGQMEATSVLINEDYPGYELIIDAVTRFSNILSINSALNIKSQNADVLKRDMLNLIYILNKGSIRNMVDNRVLGSLPAEEAAESTKADRYEAVTHIMRIVNDNLGTYSMSPYIATMDLSNWTYSIMERGSEYSKAKGRKYFEINDHLILKVDMRGPKAGGKYPIEREYIEVFKSESLKIQRLFLQVMENAARADIGLPELPVETVVFKEEDKLSKYSDDKILELIAKNNNSDIDVNALLLEAESNIKKAISEAFSNINQDRVAANL